MPAPGVFKSFANTEITVAIFIGTLTASATREGAVLRSPTVIVRTPVAVTALTLTIV